MLRVNLPSSILLPIGADINGLIKILSAGRVLDTIHAANDVEGRDAYEGASTYWVEPIALPAIEPFYKPVYRSRQDAQTEKNRIAAEANAKVRTA